MDLDTIAQALSAGRFRFTEHAREQMAKRQLTEADVRQALVSLEEVLPVREGRVVAQSMSEGHLLRVFIDVDREPMEVVTAYRTSKIDRYRSQP
ncbi:MAG: DUF4258 domain-containing protein [Pirellulales bacterium]|nr:DUF4258 domain-containing protein [Pirellulales bacterium]